MRRPWRTVLDLAAEGLRAGGDGRAGVLAALPRLPAALGRRQVLPARVEERVRRLALAEQEAARPALVA